MDNSQPSASGRTCPGSCAQETTPSGASLVHWQDVMNPSSPKWDASPRLVLLKGRDGELLGESLTLNTSDSPNAASASLLSQALEGGADPAEILFERSRLRGDSAPRGTKPEAVAPLAPGRAGTDYRARVPVGGRNSDSNFFLRENCPTLTTDGANAGRAQGASCAVIERRSRAFVGEFDISSYEPAATASTLTTHCLRPDSRGQAAAIVEQAPPPNEWLGVRKLTPVECERLQGFPDNYTRIAFRGRSAENCPDTHRYAAVGNSWAVPVIRWLGARMKTAIEEIQ